MTDLAVGAPVTPETERFGGEAALAVVSGEGVIRRVGHRCAMTVEAVLGRMATCTEERLLGAEATVISPEAARMRHREPMAGVALGRLVALGTGPPVARRGLAVSAKVVRRMRHRHAVAIVTEPRSVAEAAPSVRRPRRRAVDFGEARLVRIAPRVAGATLLLGVASATDSRIAHAAVVGQEDPIVRQVQPVAPIAPRGCMTQTAFCRLPLRLFAMSVQEGSVVRQVQAVALSAPTGLVALLTARLVGGESAVSAAPVRSAVRGGQDRLGVLVAVTTTAGGD